MPCPLWDSDPLLNKVMDGHVDVPELCHHVFEVSHLFCHLTELSKKVSLVSSFLSSRRFSIPYTIFGFCCCIFESLFFLIIFVRFGGVSSLRNGRSSKDASPNQRKERELRVLVFNSFYIDGADNLTDRPLPNSPYFFRTSVPPWTASVRVLTFNLSLHNYFYKLSISYIMLTYQNRNEIEGDIRLKKCFASSINPIIRCDGTL